MRRPGERSWASRPAERRMKKAAELTMRAAVFRGAAGELRPVVEAQRGKSGGDSSGSLPHGGAPAHAGRAARVERRTGERPTAGAGGSRGRRGKRDCLSWPNRGSRTRKFCVSEAVGSRKAVRQSSVGKIAFCGCGRAGRACAAFRGCSFGQASSDFFCGAPAASRTAFRERVCGRRGSAASF